MPLAIAASGQDAALAEKILSLLPADRIELVRAAMTSGAKMPPDVLDDLGDVRVVGEVIRVFGSLFEPKEK